MRNSGWRNAQCSVQVWLWPLSFARRAGRQERRAGAMLIYR
ncbi:hypothetical protein A2U01_0059770, partial [Trifolium medium]|nr:hypothetical protein [Trifolium medium]